MSETEQKVIEAQPEQPKKSEKPSDQIRHASNKSKKPGQSLTILAIIIAAGSLSLSGYLGLQTKTMKRQLMVAHETQSAFKAGVEQLQARIAQQQAYLHDAVQPLHEQVDHLHQREERLVDRMDSTIRRLKDLEGSSRDQWRLAEVEYLMRLANQRLLMGTEVSSARNLLTSADTILSELDDYSLFPIREALAEDIAMVRTASEFDQETAYLRLQGLVSLIPKLKILDRQHLEMAPDSTETSGFTPEPSHWQDKVIVVLKDTWSQFTNLFRINTQRDKPVETLLSVEQEIIIRQNLNLMLEQAKLAVMTREPAIYRSSIEQARAWINDYFALGGDVRASMIKELDDLLTGKVENEMPNINRSLEALKAYQFKLETPAKDSEGQQALLEQKPDSKPEQITEQAENEALATEEGTEL